MRECECPDGVLLRGSGSGAGGGDDGEAESSTELSKGGEVASSCCSVDDWASNLASDEGPAELGMV